MSFVVADAIVFDGIVSSWVGKTGEGIGWGPGLDVGEADFPSIDVNFSVLADRLFP